MLNKFRFAKEGRYAPMTIGAPAYTVGKIDREIFHQTPENKGARKAMRKLFKNAPKPKTYVKATY